MLDYLILWVQKKKHFIGQPCLYGVSYRLIQDKSNNYLIVLDIILFIRIFFINFKSCYGVLNTSNV
jgi:hypothetical protein